VEPRPAATTSRRRLLAAAAAAMVAPGCIGSGGARSAVSGAGTPLPLTGPLRVLAPPGAVAADNREAFARANGIAVDVRTTAPGPALVSLLSSGHAADVVLARQDDIAALGALGLLAELDHARIPSLSAVDSDYLNLDYDPHNRWSAPARFGAYGFGYRTDVVPEAPVDWAAFFALLPSHSLQGVSFLPGPIEPVAAALAALDEDINTESDATLLRAQGLLLGSRPHVNSFTAAPVAGFIRGELILAMGTSADFDRVLAWPGRTADTRFVLPAGRSEMWIDGWAIPAAGRRPSTAYAWIDHQLTPRFAAREWEAARLPAPEAAAARALPDGVRTDPLAALDPAIVKRYQLAVPTPAGLQKRADIWQRLRSL
jgi:spermidine/putrescine transport system substrate-binding protein